MEQILKLRNDLLQSADLRAPQNLAQQIAGQKGLTEEAGRNLASLFQVRANVQLLRSSLFRSGACDCMPANCPSVACAVAAPAELHVLFRMTRLPPFWSRLLHGAGREQLMLPLLVWSYRIEGILITVPSASNQLTASTYACVHL